MMRRIHHAYATVLGYFWLPCDICWLPFGGHERGWKPRGMEPMPSRLLCRTCGRFAAILAAHDSGGSES